MVLSQKQCLWDQEFGCKKVKVKRHQKGIKERTQNARVGGTHPAHPGTRQCVLSLSRQGFQQVWLRQRVSSCCCKAKTEDWTHLAQSGKFQTQALPLIIIASGSGPLMPPSECYTTDSAFLWIKGGA